MQRRLFGAQVQQGLDLRIDGHVRPPSIARRRDRLW
jgi:hypothetical protein